MSWVFAIIVLIVFGVTKCFGLGEFQRRLMVTDRPHWLKGIIFTAAVFIAFTLVFGMLFFAFSLNANDTVSNLRVVHAPFFAALPTAIIGIIHLVGIVIRLLKPNIGERSQ